MAFAGEMRLIEFHFAGLCEGFVVCFISGAVVFGFVWIDGAYGAPHE